MDMWVVVTNLGIVLVSIVGMCLDHHTIAGLIDIIEKLTPGKVKARVKPKVQRNVGKAHNGQPAERHPGKDDEPTKPTFGFHARGDIGIGDDVD